jgi:hypothetical protein
MIDHGTLTRTTPPPTLTARSIHGAREALVPPTSNESLLNPSVSGVAAEAIPALTSVSRREPSTSRLPRTVFLRLTLSDPF